MKKRKWISLALIAAMTDDAMKSGNIKVNPRYTSREDILNLYRKAYG